MYVRTGHTAFNTISLENTGVAPLTFSGGRLQRRRRRGPSSLFDQFSQDVPRFPRQIGVGGLRLARGALARAVRRRPPVPWSTLTLTHERPDHA